MSDVNYISMHDIRKDLIGFLKAVEAGKRYIVLQHSKPLVSLNTNKPAGTEKMEDKYTLMLETADLVHEMPTLKNPTQKYIQKYTLGDKEYDVNFLVAKARKQLAREASIRIHNQPNSQNGLQPDKPYKDEYYRGMAKKYGIS